MGSIPIVRRHTSICSTFDAGLSARLGLCTHAVPTLGWWFTVERSRLTSTASVAGGCTTAWSTSRPPQAHARPSTSNTRQSRSVQPCQRDVPRGFFVSRFRSSIFAGGSRITWFRNRFRGTPFFRVGGTSAARRCASSTSLKRTSVVPFAYGLRSVRTSRPARSAPRTHERSAPGSCRRAHRDPRGLRPPPHASRGASHSPARWRPLAASARSRAHHSGSAKRPLGTMAAGDRPARNGARSTLVQRVGQGLYFCDPRVTSVRRRGLAECIASRSGGLAAPSPRASAGCSRGSS